LTVGPAPGTPVLDVIQWIEPPTEGEPYPHLHHTGINRIAFLAHDLHGTYRQLRAAGVEFWSEPQLLHTGSGTTHYVCFSDPDGTVLELFEQVSLDDEE
jgi:catechol 2,3-dioxygenase-like lactoylglutathione lyase family enzyme